MADCQEIRNTVHPGDLFNRNGIFERPFFTFKNLTNVGRQISLNAILALGMTLVIISGGIDLSVGGVCALGCCVCAKILNSTGSSLLAIAVVLLIGLAVGAFNGFVVSKTGIAPLSSRFQPCPSSVALRW